MRKILSSKAVKYSWKMAIAYFFLFVSGNAAAWVLITSDVVSGYGSCTWRDNGDDTSTMTVVVNYKDAEGRVGPRGKFVSRGILVYTYVKDAQGNPVLRPTKNAVISMKINDVAASDWPFEGVGYNMYYYRGNVVIPSNPWRMQEAYTANLEVRIKNSAISVWPGVSIRAGNYTTRDDVGEVTGGAYFSTLGNSNCKILDPILPPPPPPPAISIDMAVPDWSLGELPRGESEKTLSGVAQQLCMTYSGDGENAARRFVIDATSENGTSGGKFFLKNDSNVNQKVPYTVTLDSGVARFDIPNHFDGAITLNKGNRTCFVPTFKTSVDLSVDTGNYSDVLSFTIVTKS